VTTNLCIMKCLWSDFFTSFLITLIFPVNQKLSMNLLCKFYYNSQFQIVTWLYIYISFYRYIDFFLDTIANADNVSLLSYLAGRLKQARDAQSSDKSEVTYLKIRYLYNIYIYNVYLLLIIFRIYMFWVIWLNILYVLSVNLILGLYLHFLDKLNFPVTYLRAYQILRLYQKFVLILLKGEGQ
jgi:hypothetical protein